MKIPASDSASPFHHLLLDDVPERVRQIAMLRGLGYSYRQIAEPLHVSPQAVSLMLSRHRRSLRCLRSAMELSSLSARAVNTLGRHGIRTREQASQTSVLERLAGERNCGKKTMDEIARWIHEAADNPGEARRAETAVRGQEAGESIHRREADGCFPS
jgi:predicted transcriptional regulator